MSRRARALRCILMFAVSGIAGAQSDFAVTMRVVEDTRGLNAAIIVIGADAVQTRTEPAAQ